MGCVPMITRQQRDSGLSEGILQDFIRLNNLIIQDTCRFLGEGEYAIDEFNNVLNEFWVMYLELN